MTDSLNSEELWFSDKQDILLREDNPVLSPELRLLLKRWSIDIQEKIINGERAADFQRSIEAISDKLSKLEIDSPDCAQELVDLGNDLKSALLDSGKDAVLAINKIIRRRTRRGGSLPVDVKLLRLELRQHPEISKRITRQLCEGITQVLLDKKQHSTAPFIIEKGKRVPQEESDKQSPGGFGLDEESTKPVHRRLTGDRGAATSSSGLIEEDIIAWINDDFNRLATLMESMTSKARIAGARDMLKILSKVEILAAAADLGGDRQKLIQDAFGAVIQKRYKKLLFGDRKPSIELLNAWLTAKSVTGAYDFVIEEKPTVANAIQHWVRELEVQLQWLEDGYDNRIPCTITTAMDGGNWCFKFKTAGTPQSSITSRVKLPPLAVEPK